MPNAKIFDAVASGWMTEAGLLNFIHRLDDKSVRLHQAENEFPGRLDEAWSSFTEAVPDLEPGAMVVLMPAPRAAVGGAVRPA